MLPVSRRRNNGKSFDRYEVEDAARTIARAEEHKNNAPLMREVKKHVAKLSHAVSAPTKKR